MTLDDYNFDLPKALIAQHPPTQRHASRMMVVHRDSGTIEHRQFLELPSLLNRNDLLIFNDTRVLPAKLIGRRQSGAAIEALLVEEFDDGSWLAIVKKAGRIKIGEILLFENDKLRAEAIELRPEGKWVLKFHVESLHEALAEFGRAPLPPYIRRGRDDAYRAEDLARYQTIFAAHDGAIAAPTAGLHFSSEIFDALEQGGIAQSHVTLHVGEGTFKPISTEDPRDHPMHFESYDLRESTVSAIAQCRKKGGRVIAVGTTSARCLEAAAEATPLKARAASTDLFIYPPYEFQVVDAMLTNFHLPKSTLLMLISALAGVELIRQVYVEAVANKYRFYSYGDCMLIV